MLQPVTRTDVPISQQFGERRDYYAVVSHTPGHNGIDLATNVGTQVYAPITGVLVEVAYDQRGWGWYIKLASTWEELAPHWLLAHLSSIGASKVGDQVEAGTPVALSGNTGNSSGPHIHVGWRPAGAYRHTLFNGWVDPEPELARLASLI